MQNYLQKKNRITVVGKFVIASCAAVMLLVTALLYNTDTRETTAFSTKRGKYMSVENKTVSPGEKQTDDADTIGKTKMNNLNDKNAKSVELAVNKTNIGVNTASKAVTDYPETLKVYFHNTGESVEMNLEEYIVGCVLAEMPSSFSSQALMAQAVAARSFTCYKWKNTGFSSHEDAAVCTDYRHCQSYISPSDYEKKGGYAKESLSKIRQAVEATRGICAVFDSEPIMAVYHASSGTGTKSCSQVWGGEVPYLTGVPAAEDMNVCSHDYTFSYDELEKKLSDEKGAVSCFSVFGRAVSQQTDPNGIVTDMSFSGRTLESAELCQKLGLRSEEFSAVISEDGVTFTSYGYGHRVGMSQYGADALAKKGYGFMDILKYYYSGVEFSYIY